MGVFFFWVVSHIPKDVDILAACVELYRDVRCKMMWTPLHPIVYHHFPHCLAFFSQKLQDSANFFFTSIFQKQFPIISPMKGPSIFQNTSGKSGHRRGGALFPRGLGPWAGLGCREAWTAWPGIPIGLEVFHGSSFQRPSGYVQIAIENGDL